MSRFFVKKITNTFIPSIDFMPQKVEISVKNRIQKLIKLIAFEWFRLPPNSE